LKAYIVALWIAVCGLNIGTLQAQDTLIVFAGASLTEAFEAMATAFEADNLQVDILFNFGGSSTLATQLNQGAPADIFASANPAQMQKAVDGERIAGKPQTFAHNRLVLIVPIDNPANITSIDDLNTPNISLILAAPTVPVRAYTDTMLDLLANNPEYGIAYRDAVLANLVSEEPNVRQVVAKIAFGEADAGIVYQSDVTPDIADDVQAFPIPDNINTIATYPIAITDDTAHSELAGAFIDFILSSDGQAIMATWGFVPLPTDKPCLLLCVFSKQMDG